MPTTNSGWGLGTAGGGIDYEKRDDCWNIRLKLSHEHLCNFVFMVIQLERKEKYQHESLGLSGSPLTCYQGREGGQRD